MKYLNANTVLPDVLIAQLQNYVQGEYLYIPAKKNRRKGWGERSGYRKEIDARNEKILQARASGVSIDALAETYSLSVHAIKKIIYQK